MKMWQNSIAYSNSIKGSVRKCPICGTPLMISKMGVNSHLNAHIKRGVAKIEDKARIMAEIFRWPRKQAIGQVPSN